MGNSCIHCTCTVEPLYKGHLGTSNFVLNKVSSFRGLKIHVHSMYRKVVIWDKKMCPFIEVFVPWETVLVYIVKIM